MDPLSSFEWKRPSPEMGGWFYTSEESLLAKSRAFVGSAGALGYGPWLACELGTEWGDEDHNAAGLSAVQLLHETLRVSEYQRVAYRPLLDQPALFRKFAQLEPDPDAILAFSAKYGRLTHGEGLTPAPQPRPSEIVVRGAEHLDTWLDWIDVMRAGVALWDALKRGERETLRALLAIEDDDEPAELVIDMRRKMDGHEGPMSGLPGEEDLTLCFSGDKRSHLYRSPDTRTRHDAAGRMSSPRIWDTEEESGGWATLRHMLDYSLMRCSPRMAESPGRLDLMVEPVDLLSALWLQFARAVDGDRSYKRCERTGCSNWFELTPSVSRSDRQYCSDSCKSKAWRENVRVALRHYECGLSVEQIAETMSPAAGEVTAEQVRGWLAAAAKRRKGDGAS